MVPECAFLGNSWCSAWGDRGGTREAADPHGLQPSESSPAVSFHATLVVGVLFGQAGKAPRVPLGALYQNLHVAHSRSHWWPHSPSAVLSMSLEKSVCREIFLIKGLRHNIHLSCLSFPTTWNAWKNEMSECSLVTHTAAVCSDTQISPFPTFRWTHPKQRCGGITNRWVALSD